MDSSSKFLEELFAGEKGRLKITQKIANQKTTDSDVAVDLNCLIER